MNSSRLAVARLQNAPGRFSSDAAWGVILVIPYVVVFAFVVVYPILYGLFLGSSPQSYRKLFQNPIYLKSGWNTLVFLIVAVNLKLLLALLLLTDVNGVGSLIWASESFALALAMLAAGFATTFGGAAAAAAVMMMRFESDQD